MGEREQLDGAVHRTARAPVPEPHWHFWLLCEVMSCFPARRRTASELALSAISTHHQHTHAAFAAQIPSFRAS